MVWSAAEAAGIDDSDTRARLELGAWIARAHHDLLIGRPLREVAEWLDRVAEHAYELATSATDAESVPLAEAIRRRNLAEAQARAEQEGWSGGDG